MNVHSTFSLITAHHFNPTQLSSFSSVRFFSIKLCYIKFDFSSSFSAVGWRGEAPEQTNTKRLFVPQRQKTHLHSFLPLSVYLLHTPSMSMSLSHLQLSTMLHLCASAHTPEYHRGTLWTSPIIWLIHCLAQPVACVLFHFLYLSLPRQHNLHPSLISSLKLVTSPNTHITVTSPCGSCSQGQRAKCWWRGQLTPPHRLGLLGGNFWKVSTTSVSHLGHLILQNLHLWISFANSINWRNAQLCRLRNEKWWDFQVSTRPPKFWQTEALFSYATVSLYVLSLISDVFFFFLF